MRHCNKAAAQHSIALAVRRQQAAMRMRHGAGVAGMAQAGIAQQARRQVQRGSALQ